jgi:hypothetical protein
MTPGRQATLREDPELLQLPLAVWPVTAPEEPARGAAVSAVQLFFDHAYVMRVCFVLRPRALPYY